MSKDPRPKSHFSHTTQDERKSVGTDFTYFLAFVQQNYICFSFNSCLICFSYFLFLLLLPFIRLNSILTKHIWMFVHKKSELINNLKGIQQGKCIQLMSYITETWMCSFKRTKNCKEKWHKNKNETLIFHHHHGTFKPN